MANDRSVLEGQMERVELRPFTLDGFHRRRQRRERNRRIEAAVVALAVAAAGIGVLVRAFSSGGPVPASDPRSLGVFEPVAGRIVYVNEGIDRGYDPGLWAVDPNGPSDTTEGLSVADDVASTLVRLGVEDATPLGWSSDGTELLFKRSDGDPLFPEEHLYILHADGSETQLNSDPMYFAEHSATIAPDGSRVVFAAQGDGGGLYVVDAEGGRPVRLAEGGSAPTFSPDGRRIAYLVYGDDVAGNVEEEHVWVANADGTDAHEILANEETVFVGVSGLEWSPAGDRLAIGLGMARGGGRPAIYTFAPDGSDFTPVITSGISPHWSPDGSQIAYTIPCDEHPDGWCPEGSVLRSEFDPQPGESPAGLAIADADGSNVREFGFAASGPWHPVPADEPTPSPARPTSPFVGAWASTNYNEYIGADTTSSQTMTIRAGEDGVLNVTVHDDSSYPCSDTPTTMTGTGRLEDPTTLVVSSPVLACVGGPAGDPPRLKEAGSNYTLVLDPATDRLYDTLGMVWNRGAPPENWAGGSTVAGVDGPGTFAILHGEVTFRATEPWNDHVEAYIDPRLFFLTGPGGEREGAGISILVNPLPPETPCDSLRVPPSAEELVHAIRSNPDLEATAPVTERVGGIEALRMDVVAAPGASPGPCNEGGWVPVVSVPGRGAWGGLRPGALGRLYVLDLPEGSARTLAIWITAPDAALFERAVETAAPVLNSFEFHTG